MARLFSVLGDSISTYEGITPEGWRVFYEGERIERAGMTSVRDTWWSLVIEHFGGQLLANSSWSGCVVQGSEFPVAASNARCEALATRGQAPDDILVYVGINDYGWGSGEAQVAAGAASAPQSLVAACDHVGRVAGMAPENAAEIFAESYARMVRKLHALYPATRIWCATLVPGRLSGCAVSTSPRYFRGVCIDAYNDAIRAAATLDGARLVDMAARGFDYDAFDGTHPTKRGMRQIATLFIEGMEASGEKAPEGALDASSILTDDMRTERFCDEPCVGCPFARSTGNEWFHICERQVARG